MLQFLPDHTYRGYEYACFPPAGISSEDALRRRLKTVDPRLRVLWVNKLWQSPNGSFEKKTHVCIAFEDKSTHRKRDVLEKVLLPTVYDGVMRYDGPFVSASILDGLEREAIARRIPEERVLEAADKWRQQGAVGDYVSLAEVFQEIVYQAWATRKQREFEEEHLLEKKLSQQTFADIRDETRKARRQTNADIQDQISEGRLQDMKASGEGDHVFLSDTSSWTPTDSGKKE